MPQVPQYDAPNVAPRALPVPAVRPTLQSADNGSLGSVLGKVADDASGVLDKIAQRAAAQANESQVLQAEKVVNDSYREFQDRTASLQGHDAEQLLPETEKWFDDTVSKVGTRLDSPAAQRAFAARMAVMREPVLNQAARTQHAEATKARYQDREASNIEAINRAALDGGDAAIYASGQMIRANADTWARDEGLDLNKPEQRARWEDYLQKNLGQLHSAVIAAMVSDPSKVGQAAEYYKAHRGEIDEPSRAKLDKVMKTATDGVQAETDVDALVRKFPGNLPAQVAAAREKYGPGDEVLRNEVITRLEHRDSVDEKATTAVRRQFDENALTLYAQAGGDYSAIPPAVLAGMTPSVRVTLMLRKGEKDRVDREAYDRARILAYQDPEAFASMDLSDPALGIDTRYRADLARLQREVGSRNAAEQTKAQTAWRTEAFAGRMASAGITSDKRIKALRADFDKAYIAEAEAFKEQNKRPPNNEEAAQIVGNLLIYGKFKDTGRLWDESNFVFEKTKYPKATGFAPDTAGNMFQTRAEAYLRGTGRDVTPDGIAKYAAYRKRAEEFLAANNVPVSETEVAKLVAKYDKAERALR